MELVVLGSGAAWPDGDRFGPSFAVVHNGETFLIDCGAGVSHQLMKAGLPPSKIKHVLFTHMHIDHCVEFPFFVFGAYLTEKKDEFKVFGPKGTKHFTSSIFDDTYFFAKNMIRDSRNQEILIDTAECDNGVFYNDDGLTIECIQVDHGCEALAYKFTADGKSIVLSGDTAPCENLFSIAKNADLLVLDCSFPNDFGVKRYHCNPTRAAEVANKVNAKKIILCHLSPPCKGNEKVMLDDFHRAYEGEVLIPNDLDKYSV